MFFNNWRNWISDIFSNENDDQKQDDAFLEMASVACLFLTPQFL